MMDQGPGGCAPYVNQHPHINTQWKNTLPNRKNTTQLLKLLLMTIENSLWTPGVGKVQ